MLGIIRRRQPIIHSQWFVPLQDFESDTGAFYQAIEDELKSRKIPELIVERIHFREAGLLSSNREYLRVRRERVVLDVCSGAFGTSWWFSARAAELPRLLAWWEVWLTLLGLINFFVLGGFLFGFQLGCIAFVASIVCLLLLFFAGRTWAGLDEFLIYLPVIGALYEAYLRKETYFRKDQRLVFANLVSTTVTSKVREFCHAGGVEEPEFIRVDSPEQILSERQLEKYGWKKSP